MSNEKIKSMLDNIGKQNHLDAESDFINSFERNLAFVSKKHKVTEKELMTYFEKEMLTIGK